MERSGRLDPPHRPQWRAALSCALLCCATLPVAARAAGDADRAFLASGIYVVDSSPLHVGSRLPAFQARGISGARVDSAALAGRPLILAFWSKYCRACVEKLGALATLQARYAPRGLAVVSVNTDGEYREGEDRIREFVAALERQRGVTLDFPVIYDENNAIPRALGISFLPTILAVGPQGDVLEVYQRFDEKGEAEIAAGFEALALRALAAGAPPAPSPKTP